MIFKCHFCPKIIFLFPRSSHSRCKDCNVKYWFDIKEKLYEIIIYLKDPNNQCRCISIRTRANETNFYYNGESPIHINHVMDISPTNALTTATKLYNLKAFL